MKYYLSQIESGSDYNLIRASLLQKLIRRGMVGEALYVGSLFLKDGHQKGLKRRIQIIAAEDIGLGWPESVNFIESQENLLLSIQALCEAPKNRESDRFLLTVANNPKSVIGRGPEILQESKILHRLFQLSTDWNENRRDKEKLNTLRSAFNTMAKDQELSDSIIQLGENYINLTKEKVHGARCQMALAVLIYCRKWPKTTTYTPSLVLKSIVDFDEIFDFAIDMHTPIGKKLKRDIDHWFKNCVQVIPEIKYPELLDSQGNEKYPLDFRK